MEENPYENNIEFALRYGELDEMPGKKKYGKLISIAAIASVILVGALSLFFVISANNKIVISFNADGGASVADIQIDKGSTIQLPVTTRTGYEFEGWYRNDTKISEETVFEKDTILIARWITEGADTFTISFDSKGGNKVESLRMECGSTLKLPEAPKRDGYSFVVWSDDNNVPILDGAQLACKDIQLVASWTKGANTDKSGPESIELNHEKVELTVGDTELLVATITPDDTKNKSVVWSSSDPETITVDANGMITAHKVGEAKITVTTINGKTASAIVYSDINTITVRASSTLNYISNYGNLDTQKSIDYTVSIFPEVPLEYTDYVWEATNTSGVTAVADLSTEGEAATLTAKNVSGSELVPVEITVSVGRVSSKPITVYVEPQLVLNGDNIIVTNNELTVTSSIDVSEWSVRAKDGSTIMNFESVKRSDRKISLKPVLNERDPVSGRPILSSDLVVTAITRANQKVDFTASCVKN